MSADQQGAGWYPVGDDLRRTAVVGLGAVLAFAPLFVIFDDWTWLVEGAGAALCVLLPTMLLRYRSVPRTVHLLPGLAVLVVYCTALYLSRSAVGGLLPGPQAWHQLADLRELAGEQIKDSVSPLHSTHALRTFVVPGLGLFAALVDWYAVVRRAPALAGVPMLALYSVCGAIAGSTVGWIPFTSAATGFLLILSADSRISLLSWGRVVPRRHGDHTARARLGLSGRRIGVVAVVAAVAIPALIPGLSRNLLADAFHSGGTGGNGEGTAISPFAELKGELTRGKPITLAHVAVPVGVKPYFLRSKVLDTFTGNGWVASGAFRGQPVDENSLRDALPLGGTTSSYTAQIRIQALSDVAPILGSAATFDRLRGAWRFDPSDGTLGGARTKRGETYTESVVAPNPAAAELTDTGKPDRRFATLTGLPATFPPTVRVQVARLTAAAKTPYQRAIALYDFFRDPANGFTYSLQTKAGDSGSDLVDFLQGRTGFCQQYAAALAVMFRVAGIPSRVVLGYTHSAPDKNGEFSITSHDAHAWVEGYFGGIGWLPFNPTPLVGADAARNVEVLYAPAPSASTSSGPTSSLTGSGQTSPNRGQTNGNDRALPRGSSNAAGSAGLPGWVLAVIGGAAALLIALLILPGTRMFRRRSRYRAALRTGRLEPLWEELHATAVDTGTAWPPSTTPRQVPAWLRERGVGVSAAIETLARGVERERYAPPAGLEREQHAPAAGLALERNVPAAGVQILSRPALSDPVGGHEVGDSIERVDAAARAMRATLGRRGRARALLLPASVTTRWRRARPMSD